MALFMNFTKIGVYYGNPEVTSGGIALKFFASVRLEIRSTGKIKSVSTSTFLLSVDNGLDKVTCLSI